MVMHFKEYGDIHKPLILLIHGGGVGGWMWDKQVQYFSDYHCVVPELIDNVAKNNSNFSIEDSAKTLLSLIEEKAKNKCVIVVGFSLGAQIAIQMVSLKPQLIDFAIINSALVTPSTVAKKWIRPMIKLTFPLIKNKSFAKLQAKTLYVDEEYFEQYYEDSSKIKVDNLIKILQENMSFAIPHDFSKARCKILVTVGEKEKSNMKKSAIHLVNSNPNCQGVVLSNIGHGVSLAHPEFFNRFVEEWMKDGKLPEGKVINYCID
ncbi:alpha/beta fold hydrolase [Lysinibacillus sp. Ag94]|uniref:alpha/beta fold hydrolase n=1 Tax=Lysinibacillus sp. Ag94 TaxID=2936682 RepID=UPI00200EFD43|nr:alpha/beta hydrolase [Lysinibacillus sp. Ag94]UPW85410.1 alpha/beta hydrolase [Lysinibacillus sp. Ag94]